MFKDRDDMISYSIHHKEFSKELLELVNKLSKVAGDRTITQKINCILIHEQ